MQTFQSCQHVSISEEGSRCVDRQREATGPAHRRRRKNKRTNWATWDCTARDLWHCFAHSPSEIGLLLALVARLDTFVAFEP
jgi:hypothetical protein